MYSDVKKGRRGLLLLALLCLAVLILAVCVFGGAGRDLSEESAEAIEAAIRRGAMQCYVVEGAYPPNIRYLEEKYGIQVNTEDYYVVYDAFASNLPPTVIVKKK